MLRAGPDRRRRQRPPPRRGRVVGGAVGEDRARPGLPAPEQHLPAAPHRAGPDAAGNRRRRQRLPPVGGRVVGHPGRRRLPVAATARTPTPGDQLAARPHGGHAPGRRDRRFGDAAPGALLDRGGRRRGRRRRGCGLVLPGPPGRCSRSRRRASPQECQQRQQRQGRGRPPETPAWQPVEHHPAILRALAPSAASLDPGGQLLHDDAEDQAAIGFLVCTQAAQCAPT